MHALLSVVPPLRRWLILLPLLCALGCSGNDKLNPVKGKLLYKDQPLKGALVTFHPQGATDAKTLLPVGHTDEEGNFTLSTGPDAGAPEGEYVITVICPEEVKQKGPSMEPPDSKDRFKGAYANRATSKIKQSIKKGPNELEPIRLQ
jgi:hypothetical protein